MGVMDVEVAPPAATVAAHGLQPEEEDDLKAISVPNVAATGTANPAPALNEETIAKRALLTSMLPTVQEDSENEHDAVALAQPAVEQESDDYTSSSSERVSSFSILAIPGKVRASIFSSSTPKHPLPPRSKKKKKVRAATADTSSSLSSAASAAPTVTAVSPLRRLASTISMSSGVSTPQPTEPEDKFKHFWDEKLRLTMERLTNSSKTDANGDATKDVFHLLLKLYAHQDVVEELYSSFEANASEFEFYIPQLCTFLIHGKYAKQHQLECFLMTRSGESLTFAHRLQWFLRSFCSDAKEYQSEYLSVTTSADQENSDLLTAIKLRAGVPALLMNNGLCSEEVAAKPANLRRRRSSVFDIDQDINPEVLASDESFAGHLQQKRDMVVYEARPDEGNPQQISLYAQSPTFVKALTDLADWLIPKPLASRNEELRKGLMEIQRQLLPSDVIYMPIGNFYHRVKAILIDECFTFSTKERVPYFLCVEVLDYSVSAPAATTPRVRKKRSRSRQQSRGFHLKLPFTTNGIDSAVVVPNEFSSTAMDNQDECGKRDSHTSNTDSLSTAEDLATSEKSPAKIEGKTITESSKHVAPQKTEEKKVKLSFFASLFGSSIAHPPIIEHRTESNAQAVIALTPKDDGEDGDDEKEADDLKPVLLLPQQDSQTIEKKEEDGKENEDARANMGQWGMPRARRRNKSRTLASTRSGDEFDSFYISWFSKKMKEEGFTPVSDGASTPAIVGDMPTEPLTPSTVETTQEKIENTTKKPETAPGSSNDAVDNDSSQDEAPKRRTRDMSTSLDFTDSNAWKVNFDLEDGLTDNEFEVTDNEHDTTKPDCDAETDKEKKEDEAVEEKPMIVFRERWSEKEARIRKDSPYGSHPGWRLLPVIVKSNDDLRQEQFAAQLIAQCDRIFREYDLPLSLRPYNVIATSAKTGLIEAVPDTVSLDSLKRNDPEYTTLLDFYYRLHGDKDSIGFARARRNFVESLAAYSIVCYVFQIKDRHNGNILIDTHGHVVHIDFGFLLTNSPGSNLNFEKAPFKLTDEFVELMGGPRSSTFRYFRSLCIRAYLALRRNMDEIVLLAEMMLIGNSDLPCFAGGQRAVIEGLRARLKAGARTSTCQVFVNQLIDQSINNWRTRWYDKYQRACLGIL